MSRHHIINNQKVDFTDAEETARDAEEKAFLVEQAKTLYIEQRLRAYPQIGDQLDKIYHEGIDEWKKVIKAVKDNYPKP
jgi:hypothetical protein